MGFGRTCVRCVAALGLTSAVATLSIPEDFSINTANKATLISSRAADDDPTDFSWIENWAAIGDSFTAGIGSGNQLGNSITLDEAWKCSRYDYSWAKIVDNAMGSSVKNFQFEACSGNRTADVYNQVDELRTGLDVVMMTAGGNDLCLGAMIKTCENIETILKDNIRQVLDKLNGKIKKDGALVYSGYAPFFNTENEDCADPDKQNWALKAWRWWQFWNWLNSSLKLTVDRRKKFNTLVDNINKAISEVVEDWPGIVDGQFCSPKSTGVYPDPKQPDLLFIKFDTSVSKIPPHDETKRRRDLVSGNGSVAIGAVEVDSAASPSEQPEQVADDSQEMKRHLEDYQNQLRGRLTRKHIYDSLLWNSPNPGAEALHKLDARAPAAPGCPGDSLPGVPLGLGLPDSFLSIFHPNKQGHEAMAAYALQNLVLLRADILGIDDGLCSQTRDEFTCWQKEGKRAFVEFKLVDENYKDFCNDVKPPGNTINWKWEKTYYADTPDEHTISLELFDGASEFDKNLCLESLDRIINSCDGNDPKNPLNFKYGGRWVRGNYNYHINPKKDRTMITKRDGTCRGWWKFFFVSYRVYGRGWAGHDYGQKTLLKAMRDCGSAVTGWKFEYCNDGCGKDNSDFEWKAEFNLPVYGGAACMKNNWVPRRGGAEWYSRKKPRKIAPKREWPSNPAIPTPSSLEVDSNFSMYSMDYTPSSSPQHQGAYTYTSPDDPGGLSDQQYMNDYDYPLEEAVDPSAYYAAPPTTNYQYADYPSYTSETAPLGPRHLKTHDKPYKCTADEFCDKQFADKKDLDRHIRSTHQPSQSSLGVAEERVTCPDCGKEYTRRDNYVRHKSKNRCNPR
ncbi:hypothetical protein CkaCkLH20_05694 [Colletotrichum karsti]|uniref:C2H2-type domain-containing protein n=1 Tax=Colletotrichum karsti TaxID=1095194 RepID=A0A9P6I3V7_9PEZI|nr:uncharacterized protein CkaCkLH20_05694 [Colletotrichum karsti]KAF9876848.1 hypothetical protein CkaCkLH20_05694 [Colletotrichum karsti]